MPLSQRQLISRSLLGRKKSEHTRRLISEGMKKYWDGIEENTFMRLRDKAAAFCQSSVDDLPLAYMFPYIKEEDDKEDGVSEARINREIVWVFKNDSDDYSRESYNMVKQMVVTAFASQLFGCFKDDISNLVLIPVPCSSAVNHAFRWCGPMQEICDAIAKNTHCEPPINGYLCCTYVTDGKPDHLNKGHMAYPTVEYHADELAGKHVILIDDICASGNHIRKTRKELEKIGAYVIAAFVIAKTPE